MNSLLCFVTGALASRSTMAFQMMNEAQMCRCRIFKHEISKFFSFHSHAAVARLVTHGIVVYAPPYPQQNPPKTNIESIVHTIQPFPLLWRHVAKSKNLALDHQSPNFLTLCSLTNQEPRQNAAKTKNNFVSQFQFLVCFISVVIMSIEKSDVIQR